MRKKRKALTLRRGIAVNPSEEFALIALITAEKKGCNVPAAADRTRPGQSESQSDSPGFVVRVSDQGHPETTRQCRLEFQFSSSRSGEVRQSSR